MHWLFAGLAAVGFVELLIRLPIIPKLAEIRATVSSALAVVRSRRISDHWKEKALLRYAFRLFWLTMLLAVYFVGALLPLILIYLVSIAIGVAFMEFILSLVGILFATIVSIVYARVRFGRVRTQL